MEVDFATQTPEETYGTLRGLRVAIVGLGLMGGSLAMALRGQCAELVGIDPDPETRQFAIQKGIVDRCFTNLHELPADTGLIILAAPACAILSILSKLHHANPHPRLIFDIGSTKVEIMKAMSALPDHFDPLGMHPICGKEHNGLAFAEANLFQGAPLVLTPLPRTSARAVIVAEELAAAIGAKPARMEADKHDRQVAATSHLPYLLASALALATPSEALPLTGPGFRGATRLAASSPHMMLDILRTNRKNVLAALGLFRQALDRLENMIDGEDWDGLEEMLAASAAARAKLMGIQAGGTR